MTSRVDCKVSAKELLRGRWKNAVGATFLFFVSTFVLNYLLSLIPILGWVGIILTSSFLTGSFIKYCIKLSEVEGSIKYLDCLISFKTTLKMLVCNILVGLIVGLSKIIFTMIFSTVSVLSQSAVLGAISIIALIVLGFFIQAIFFPVPMILVEDEGVGIVETIEISYNITKGYRFSYIIMNLSFLGFIILSLLTFGIGMLWLQPYMVLAFYLFYKVIRSENATI